MKKLTIRWQRLVDDNARTCPRCGATGASLQAALQKLAKALAALGIEVELVEKKLAFPLFNQDPQQSNTIWLNDRLLEEWLGATTGSSQCCDVCGDADCRTISVGDDTYEAVPESLIIRAALLAAAQLIADESS